MTAQEVYLLERARKNVDAYYERWKAKPPEDMISNAAIARVLWLMAETKTEAGRAFWQKTDRSGDATSGGEHRGRDNAKNVDGRKRHIVVDSMDFLLAILVTAADVGDAKAAPELFSRLDGQPVSKVDRVFADESWEVRTPGSEISHASRI